MKALAPFVKWGVVIATGWFVYASLTGEKGVDEAFWEALRSALSWRNAPGLLLAVGFVPLNYSLEALKWRHLAYKVEAVSFAQALHGVLSGASMAFTGATQAGDYLGRVWHLKASERYESLGAFLLGGVSQTYATYLFGALGLLHYAAQTGYITVSAAWWLALGLAAVNLAGAFLLHKTRLVVRLFRFWKFLYKYLKIVETYSPGEILTVVALAQARYAVFATQSVAALYVFGVELPLEEVLAGVSLVFLAKTAAPNFNLLTDLGLRGASAVYFFGEVYGAPTAPVVAALLLVWLLNRLVPVLAGLLFVIRMRIVKE